MSQPTQIETLAAAKAAAASLVAAYWATTASANPSVRANIAALEQPLVDLITHLTQEDLASRSQDFEAAAQSVKTQVLPGIKALDASVAKLVSLDEKMKQALSDLETLSTSLGLFSIPVPKL